MVSVVVLALAMHAPFAYSNLINVSAEGTQLRWDSIPGAKTYEIYRSDTGSSPFANVRPTYVGAESKIATVRSTYLRYIDQLGTPNNEYAYRVKAMDGLTELATTSVVKGYFMN